VRRRGKASDAEAAVGPRVVVAAVPAVGGNGHELEAGRGAPRRVEEAPGDFEAAIELDAEVRDPGRPHAQGKGRGLAVVRPRGEAILTGLRRDGEPPVEPALGAAAQRRLLTFRGAQRDVGLGDGLAGLAIDHEAGHRDTPDLEIEGVALGVGNLDVAPRMLLIAASHLDENAPRHEHEELIAAVLARDGV
jgi:hypothetical protein